MLSRRPLPLFEPFEPVDEVSSECALIMGDDGLLACRCKNDVRRRCALLAVSDMAVDSRGPVGGEAAGASSAAVMAARCDRGEGGGTIAELLLLVLLSAIAAIAAAPTLARRVPRGEMDA